MSCGIVNYSCNASRINFRSSRTSVPLGAIVSVAEIDLAVDADAEHAKSAQREQKQLAERGARERAVRALLARPHVAPVADPVAAAAGRRGRLRGREVGQIQLEFGVFVGARWLRVRRCDDRVSREDAQRVLRLDGRARRDCALVALLAAGSAAVLWQLHCFTTGRTGRAEPADEPPRVCSAQQVGERLRGESVLTHPIRVVRLAVRLSETNALSPIPSCLIGVTA